MDTRRTEQFGLVLLPSEKRALERLAEAEGGLSQAATLRRLIREAATLRGLWLAPHRDEQPEEVRHA